MSDELHLVCNDCQELKYACRCGNGEAELENYRQKKVLKLCHEARELCKESPLAAPAGSAASLTKAERATEMSRVRKLGVKRSKTKVRALRQNAELRQQPPEQKEI